MKRPRKITAKWLKAQDCHWTDQLRMFERYWPDGMRVTRLDVLCWLYDNTHHRPRWELLSRMCSWGMPDCQTDAYHDEDLAAFWDASSRYTREYCIAAARIFVKHWNRKDD